MKKRLYLIVDMLRSSYYDLTPTESLLASFMFGIPSWASNLIIEGQVWYQCDYSSAIENCSICTEKKDTMQRLYKSLEKKGLIHLSKFNSHVYIQLCDPLKEWGSEFECEKRSTDLNPKNTDENTDLNPTKYYIREEDINKENLFNSKESNKQKESWLSFDEPEPEIENKPKFSKKHGFSEKTLKMKQSVINKVDSLFDDLVFPYENEEFKKKFFILCLQPKWRKRSFMAIQNSLKSIAKYPVEFAMELADESLNKDWGALEYDSTPNKFKAWEAKNKDIKVDGSYPLGMSKEDYELYLKNCETYGVNI